MTRVCWWFAYRLARVLEPSERDAVLGDIVESGEPGWQALRDVLGLAVRRQTALWKSFRPWLATIAVVVPAGLLLNVACVQLANGYDLYSWIIWNYKDMDPALLAENHLSVGRGMLRIARALLTLIAWSLNCGFALGSLSRQATRLTGILSFGVFLSGPVIFAPQGQFIGIGACTIMCVALASSAFGVRLGRRPAIPATVQAVLWTAAILTALTVRYWLWWLQWSGGRAGLLLVAAYWPTAFTTHILWAHWRASQTTQGENT